MGVNIRDLVTPVRTDLKSLSGCKIGVDAFNWLYQFISTIRQPDGTPLMDSKGRVTSHLTGLFYRVFKLLEYGIKPCFVFDGKAPDFKLVTAERVKRKVEAKRKYAQALAEEDFVRARSLAGQTSRLTGEMVSQAKELIIAMGLPVIQAPSEGEAQIAYMTSQGDFWASASQDYDTLLFGSPRLVKNINIVGKKRLPRGGFVEVVPEVIELKSLLESLGLSREQLIQLGVLVGTDFNPGGVKGVGPKTALKLVRAHTNPFTQVDWVSSIKPEFIIDFFLHPPVIKDYKLVWSAPDFDKVKSILTSFEFSETRIENVFKKFRESGQSQLNKWF
ncbi:MAG: flap endonuclease-1 [Candidatus Nanoarchaeia archaeon]|jgi:flap endonuclease-1